MTKKKGFAAIELIMLITILAGIAASTKLALNNQNLEKRADFICGYCSGPGKCKTCHVGDTGDQGECGSNTDCGEPDPPPNNHPPPPPPATASCPSGSYRVPNRLECTDGSIVSSVPLCCQPNTPQANVPPLAPFDFSHCPTHFCSSICEFGEYPNGGACPKDKDNGRQLSCCNLSGYQGKKCWHQEHCDDSYDSSKANCTNFEDSGPILKCGGRDVCCVVDIAPAPQNNVNCIQLNYCNDKGDGANCYGTCNGNYCCNDSRFNYLNSVQINPSEIPAANWYQQQSGGPAGQELFSSLIPGTQKPSPTATPQVNIVQLSWIDSIKKLVSVFFLGK